MVQNKLYSIIEGEDILKLSESKSQPLIEGVLYENDYILWVAEEKTGKTIIAQQLACALTSGTPFLGSFDVKEPCNVWYFPTEGKTEDLKDRFIRMNRAVPLDINRLKIIPTSFRFNTKQGIESLEEIIRERPAELPKVIIIDALYQAIKGSIQKDDIIIEFNHTVRWLIRNCDCAVVLTHHMTKPQRDKDGKYFTRSDKDSYGSTFLSAAVDHIFTLEKWTKDPDMKMDRLLKCDTQRSNNIIESTRLRLLEPDPLYFVQVSTHAKEREIVMNLLRNVKEHGMNMQSLEKKSRISRTILYQIVKELALENLICKEGSKTKFYKLMEYRSEDIKKDTKGTHTTS